MSNIKQLDPHIANLIAAGEVIERAASVVKELVENSIDAHAKNIKIHLIESGLTEIRVIDDGDGMDSFDAKMCVLPHATSKIKNENDLFSIKTLGFRGEALPSIVAVSNFRLTTSTNGQGALMFSLKGGVPMTEAIVAHSKGTEIVVKNLFFNTPARLQNLQSPNVELSHITDFVTKIALSMPDISFTLTNNEKVLIKTTGNGDLLEVISAVLGIECAKNMFKVFDTNGTYRVEGYISNITLARASKNYIYLFINKRVFRSYSINNAILKGYDTLLMNGKFPVIVLNIEADPNIVDVNVHPTKAEVRFYDEINLLKMITEMISLNLNKQNLAVNLSFIEEEIDPIQKFHQEKNIEVNKVEESIMFDYNFENDDEVIEEDNLDIDDDLFINENPIEEELFVNDLDDEEIASLNKSISEEQEPILEEKYVQQQYDLFDEEINNEREVKKDRLGKLYYIGQLFGTYLIAQTEEELVLIDQHAAAERINYEKILIELENSENVGYDLLVPFNLEFSTSDCLLINENMETIKNLGIGLEEFGNNSFIVRSIPVWIFRGREKEFIEEIILQIIKGNKSSKKEFLNSLAKSLACKKSIKANEYHDTIEIEYLLEDLKNTSNPFTCPHGRPIIIKFTKYEIEKWFKRVV